MADYDGRYSDDCKKACAEGTCYGSRSSLGCGGCCGCLGGCFRGYQEQEEAAVRQSEATQ